MSEPERIYAIRRTDGELIGDEYSFLVASGPHDWEGAENDAECGMDAAEYELVEMTVRSIEKRRLPEDPHKRDNDECEYCGEPWPCEWVRDHAESEPVA